MIAIRNSKLYVLIALLLSIATLGNAIGWFAVIGLIAAGVTIGVGIAQVYRWIKDDIEKKEKTLADMENELKKAKKQRDDNADKKERWDKSIARYDELRGQAQSKLDKVTPKYEAAKTTYDTAKSKYEKYSKEYEQLKRSYMDHTASCYYCDANNRCYEGTSLEQRMSSAWKSSKKWKIKRDNAKSPYKSKRAEKNKWNYYVNKYTRIRDTYQKATDALVESHAILLKRIETLEKDIPVKEKELEAAEADLDMVEAAEKEYPGYLDRLEKADQQGKDMKQWIINNPPPKNFEGYLEKYHQ